MEWKKYLDQVKKAICQGYGVYIYGAGGIGRALYNKLLKEGILIKGFLVTDVSVNKKKEHGLPIIGINNFCKHETTLVLVAIKTPWNRDAAMELKKRKIDYIDMFPCIENLVRKPDLFEINASVGCVVKCKYCPQDVLLKKYNGIRSLTMETFSEILDKVPIDMLIAFSGFSEPFQNPHMTSMIRYAYEKGHAVSLCTTLVGLSIEKLKLIYDIPFEHVTLHLPDAEGNALIPMTEEYFKVLEEIIEWKRPGTSLRMITKANCQGKVHPRIKKILNQRIPVYSELVNRAGYLDNESLHGVKNIQGEIYCRFSSTLNNHVLMPNGDIVLCCMDFGLRHILGNMLKSSYEEIRESDELRKVRLGLAKESDVLCRHCTEARQINVK